MAQMHRRVKGATAVQRLAEEPTELEKIETPEVIMLTVASTGAVVFFFALI